MVGPGKGVIQDSAKPVSTADGLFRSVTLLECPNACW